ncbi:MAG: class D beta-lactamase [Pseudomonas sp.]|nr:class D beta-lactamase [Pseudomonas sp.]
MPQLFLALLFLGFCGLAHAEDAEIARLFDEAGVKGTLLIESAETGQRFVHDEARAKQPFTAASTFKVLNTLIALEEGAIAGADEIIPWDNTRYEIEDWNRDHTLKSAFQVSCVWCYQWLARRVGAADYPPHIRQAHYGQLREPFNGTEFWLDGSLTISAEQQIDLLKRITERSLPYRANSYDTLKTVMLSEAAKDYRLYAKTGWAARSTPGTGWYIGYVELAENTWLFALNIETHGATDLPLRQQIALSALRAKGILPAD